MPVVERVGARADLARPARPPHQQVADEPAARDHAIGGQGVDDLLAVAPSSTVNVDGACADLRPRPGSPRSSLLASTRPATRPARRGTGSAARTAADVRRGRGGPHGAASVVCIGAWIPVIHRSPVGVEPGRKMTTAALSSTTWRRRLPEIPVARRRALRLDGAQPLVVQLHGNREDRAKGAGERLGVPSPGTRGPRHRPRVPDDHRGCAELARRARRWPATPRAVAPLGPCRAPPRPAGRGRRSRRRCEHRRGRVRATLPAVARAPSHHHQSSGPY